MSDLPKPVAAYIAASNDHDADACAACFTDAAVVQDEGREMRGVAAIREWMDTAIKKYRHTVAPIEVAHREGKAVLKAKLTGNFPGSPVTLEFSFVLEDGKIVSLEIH